MRGGGSDKQRSNEGMKEEEGKRNRWFEMGERWLGIKGALRKNTNKSALRKKRAT